MKLKLWLRHWITSEPDSPLALGGGQTMLSQVMAKKKNKDQLPIAAYPVPPRLVGLDRLELSVAQPAQSAQLYQAIGLSPRTTVGRSPRLALGGMELVLRRQSSALAHNNALRSTSKGESPVKGIQLCVTVDDVDAKRRQLIELGLKPSPLRNSKRGDRSFKWQDPDGHVFCFTGPARRPDDRSID